LHSSRFGYRRDPEQQICFGLNVFRRDHSFTNEKRQSWAIRDQANPQSNAAIVRRDRTVAICGLPIDA